MVKDYEDGVKKIPTACITVEDAEMMWRMATRGVSLFVKIYFLSDFVWNIMKYEVKRGSSWQCYTKVVYFPYVI